MSPSSKIYLDKKIYKKRD